MEDESVSKKRPIDGLAEFGEDDPPEVKRLREDLLEDLDEESDLCTWGHDLDSFMRSFQEEITASPTQHQPAVTLDQELGPGEPRPDLGFLLEASDDELGLPPSNSSPNPSEVGNHDQNELARAVSDSSELNELWGFEDHIQSYDSLALPVGEADGCTSGLSEYVVLDGLFDHSDLGFWSSDNIWRSETLPAQ